MPGNSSHIAEITAVSGGTVTSPQGFSAGGVYIGLKSRGEDKLDLALLVSDTPCSIGGVFTTSAIRSATVDLDRGTGGQRTGSRSDRQCGHRQHLRGRTGIQGRRGK